MKITTETKQTLTYSALSTFSSCHKKYAYRYKENLVPTETPRFFAFGSAIHKALEIWFNAQKNKPVIEEEERKAVFNQAFDSLSEYGLDADDLAKAQALFSRYTEKYKDEDFYVEAIEYEFEQPIKSKRGYKSPYYILRGKIDGLVYMNGEYYILEHKTTSACSDAYKARIVFDRQIALYAIAVQQEFNITVKGAIYDVLQKPLIRVKKDETAEQFAERCKEVVNDENFHREIVEFDPDYLDKIRTELWLQTKEIFFCEKENGFFCNTSACMTYGSPCEYLELCQKFGNVEACEGRYTTQRAHAELSETE